MYMDQRILPPYTRRRVGDCLKTCVVNLTGQPYDSVPHFAMYGKKWFQVLHDWAWVIGYRTHCLIPETDDLPDLLIGTGPTSRGLRHAVLVNSQLELVHDPYPNSVGLLKIDQLVTIEKINWSKKGPVGPPPAIPFYQAK